MPNPDPTTIRSLARLARAIRDFDAACSAPAAPDRQARRDRAYVDLVQAVRARCDFAADLAVRRDREARGGP